MRANRCRSRACRSDRVPAILALLVSIPRIITAVTLFVFPIAAPCHLETVASAQGRSPVEAPDRLAKFIEQASTRFAVPARWVCGVMQVESAGDDHAISPRGAMGLMQLMPATWAELSARHGLGLDPFDASDNILAGTAYLKVMHDRFGSAGFLAAYHPGPARCEQHLAAGQPLPPETIAYVAAVAPLLTEEQDEHTVSRSRRMLSWRESPLFIERVSEP